MRRQRLRLGGMRREVEMGFSLRALAHRTGGRLTELSQVELTDASSLPNLPSGLTLPSAKLRAGWSGGGCGWVRNREGLTLACSYRLGKTHPFHQEPHS